jgi:hypothetical protein
MAVALCQGCEAEGGTLFYSTVKQIPQGVAKPENAAIAECFEECLNDLKGHLALFGLKLGHCTENAKFKACKEGALDENGIRAALERMSGFQMLKKHAGATNHFFCAN